MSTDRGGWLERLGWPSLHTGEVADEGTKGRRGRGRGRGRQPESDDGGTRTGPGPGVVVPGVEGEGGGGGGREGVEWDMSSSGPQESEGVDVVRVGVVGVRVGVVLVRRGVVCVGVKGVADM